jgi:CubicO group peptidase (beta-lactamase class C family)
MRHRSLVFCCVAWLIVAATERSSAESLVDTAKLDALAAPLVDGDWVQGAAVGLITEQGTQVIGYGRQSEADTSVPDADTVFEIGSISKVFTGLLLADLIERHEVERNEPVQNLLGDSMTVPKREDREITLVDLSTHTSGLPRMPGNFRPKDANNPYADYSVEQMGEFISKHKLSRAPGKRSAYSNLGVGLLGHALALKSGMTYEELLRQRIAQPLGMADTTITLSDDQRKRLAQGHDVDGSPAANWDLPTLAGAGAIRSTAADMLKFLAAQIGLAKTPLDAAIAASQSIHFKNPDGAVDDMALGWLIRRGDKTVWHNGQTGGYHAFAAFNREKRLGVVVLANTATMNVDRWGWTVFELLSGRTPKPIDLPASVAVDAEALEPLVGQYKLSDAVQVTVTRQRNRLFVQLTGQPKLRVYPQSATRFAWRAVDAAVTFKANDEGKIERLVIHQNGAEVPATRSP